MQARAAKDKSSTGHNHSTTGTKASNKQATSSASSGAPRSEPSHPSGDQVPPSVQSDQEHCTDATGNSPSPIAQMAKWNAVFLRSVRRVLGRLQAERSRVVPCYMDAVALLATMYLFYRAAPQLAEQLQVQMVAIFTALVHGNTALHSGASWAASVPARIVASYSSLPALSELVNVLSSASLQECWNSVCVWLYWGGSAIGHALSLTARSVISCLGAWLAWVLTRRLLWGSVSALAYMFLGESVSHCTCVLLQLSMTRRLFILRRTYLLRSLH